MVFGTAVGSGVFAGSEKAVESHGCELADSPQVLFRELLRSRHFHKFEKDGGVDRPYSVESRICSGKGTQKVTSLDVYVC